MLELSLQGVPIDFVALDHTNKNYNDSGSCCLSICLLTTSVPNDCVLSRMDWNTERKIILEQDTFMVFLSKSPFNDIDLSFSFFKNLSLNSFWRAMDSADKT